MPQLRLNKWVQLTQTHYRFSGGPPMFKRLEIKRWRQFAEVGIDFHPTLTVLTGANGAGKTTLLNILNRHFGWTIGFVSTPLRRKDVVEFFADYWMGRGTTFDQPDSAGWHEIGSLTYADGHRADVVVPTSPAAEYQLDIRGQQTVPGIFISSHRPISFYQRVDTIPTQLDAREQLLSVYINEMRQRYQFNARVTSPGHKIKEALISLATFGYGNEVVARNPEAVRIFEGFQSVLRRVLPAALGFKRLSIEMPEVILETATGRFSFDAVSGGVSSIIDQAWQLFMYSLSQPRFVAVIDEPENHLHPELQRSLLPSFLKAFPRVQFVVATHNSFIVTSVPESNVYVLRFGRDRHVRSTLLDDANKAGSSNEILRDVLGVEQTTPIWAEGVLREIVARYQSTDFNEDTLPNLKRDLGRLGMEHLFPDAVRDVVTADDPPQ